MKFDPTKDYYRILGVPTNATPEEIKKARNEWMKLNHPDQVTRAKEAYVKGGGDDPTTIAMFEEQYQRKTEEAKLVNEAYAVLSDPSDRASYDSMRTSGTKGPDPVPPTYAPEIVLSTTRLNFGTVNRGDKKSLSFTISNRGGAPDSVHIDWDMVPRWAEALVIEPDAVHTFPIKVTVTVKTDGLTADSYDGTVLIVVDGEQYAVSVTMKVAVPAPYVAPVRPTPPPPPAPTPVYTPKPDPIEVPWKALVVLFCVVACVAFFAISSANADAAKREADAKATQESAQATATALLEVSPTQILPTQTVVPTRDPNVVCDGSYPSYLRKGVHAHTSAAIWFQSLPTWESETLHFESGNFIVIDGPICVSDADGVGNAIVDTWWKFRSNEPLYDDIFIEGWSTEADVRYGNSSVPLGDWYIEYWFSPGDEPN